MGMFFPDTLYTDITMACVDDDEPISCWISVMLSVTDSDSDCSGDVGSVQRTSSWHSALWIHRRTLSSPYTWSV